MATKKTSTKFDTAHNIETEADLTNKTAEVFNLVTGEKYSGGSSVEVEALSVTENGTYSEEGKAYSPVTVNVAGSDLFELATTGVNNYPAKTEVIANDGEGYYRMTLGNFTPLEDQGDIYVPAFTYTINDGEATFHGNHAPQGEFYLGGDNYLYLENTAYIEIHIENSPPDTITLSTSAIKAYYMSDDALNIFPSSTVF